MRKLLKAPLGMFTRAGFRHSERIHSGRRFRNYCLYTYPKRCNPRRIFILHVAYIRNKTSVQDVNKCAHHCPPSVQVSFESGWEYSLTRVFTWQITLKSVHYSPTPWMFSLSVYLSLTHTFWGWPSVSCVWYHRWRELFEWSQKDEW